MKEGRRRKQKELKKKKLVGCAHPDRSIHPLVEQKTGRIEGKRNCKQKETNGWLICANGLIVLFSCVCVCVLCISISGPPTSFCAIFFHPHLATKGLLLSTFSFLFFFAFLLLDGRRHQSTSQWQTRIWRQSFKNNKKKKKNRNKGE